MTSPTDYDAGLVEPIRPGQLAQRLIDMNSIGQLLTLDDVWSAYLDPDFPRGAADYDGLIELGFFIKSGIVEVDLVADRLSSFFANRSDEEVARGIVALRSQGIYLDLTLTFEEIGRTTITGDIEPGQSSREDWLEACDYIRSQIDDEQVNLDRKISQLGRSDTLPDPDLRPLFRCALAFLGVGAAVAAMIIAPPVGAMAGTVIGLNVVSNASNLVGQWNGSGCGQIDLRNVFRNP